MIEPFDLNLRHLRALPLIIQHANMSAAAEAANLSQPALTQGVAKLEAQLDVRLFERRPDGMAPTPEGTAFADRASRALAHLADGARVGARGSRGFARPDRLMTATQLKAFLALAEAGSFVEAARMTDWSQPAIHRAVRDLEQVGGVPLAERRGRGVALTSEGHRLARAVRLARAELAAAIEESRPDASERGRLAIGAMPLCRAQLLPAAIAALMRVAPHATIDVVEGSWRELVEPLREGVIDLMVGALRDDPPPIDIEQEPLFLDRLVLVTREGHPLAGTSPSLDDLAAYPWIVGGRDTPLRSHWEALFAGRPRPHAPIECGSVMTIRGILIDSDCVTLLSPSQVAMEVEGGLLTLFDLPDEGLNRTIGISTRAGWRPTLLQNRALEAVRAAAATQNPKKLSPHRQTNLPTAPGFETVGS